MRSEIQRAARRLARAPGFTSAAALTLAIAVGANGMIFSAVRALLDRPLPFHEAERIVWIQAQTGGPGAARLTLTSAETNGLAAFTTTYDAVAVIGDRAFLRVGTDGRRDRWHGIWITPSLFDVLGIRPVLGRPITPEDARTGERVMMLGHERWQRDLGADTSIVGRVIHFDDGHTFIVAGVLPPRLEFPFGRLPQSGNGSGFVPGAQDFWILGQEGSELPDGMTIARLTATATTTSANVEARGIIRRLLADGMASDSARSMVVIPMRDQALGLVRPGLRLAQGFALLLVLLACANLTNLMLLRAQAREQELAIHVAMGAGWRTMVGGMLAEVGLLAVVGGMVGLALAGLAQRAIGVLAAGSVPMLEQVVMDQAVVLFTLGAATLIPLLASVIPAVIVAGSDIHTHLIAGGRSLTASRRQTRIRAALVGSQVALALVLSVGAALLATSFARLMTVDAGYDPRGVVTAEVEIFDHPDPPAFYRDLRRTLRNIPGVEAVGLVHSTPLTGKWTFEDPFVIVGRTSDPETAPRVAGAFIAFDYFAAMKTPILRGRAFTEAEDMDGNAPVLIINESAARRFFPAQDPVGESVVLAGKARRIVGVVKDMRDVRLDAPAEPQWFQPLFGAGTELIVRVSGDASAAVPMLRRQLLAVDSRFIVNRIEPLDDIIATTVAERSMAMRLLAALALVALTMSAIGLYGVLAFNVVRRRREFGIRSALGAQRHALLGMILRDGLAMASLGVLAGIALSLGLARGLESLLFEVSPTEPVVIVSIAVLLLLVAAAASAVPGWRAASVDPALALRAE